MTRGGRGGGRGRGGSSSGRRENRKPKAGIKVSVYNTGGSGRAELLDVLREGGAGKFRVVEAQIQDARAFLTVGSQEDAEAVARAHGTPHKGGTLSIRIVGPVGGDEREGKDKKNGKGKGKEELLPGEVVEGGGGERGKKLGKWTKEHGVVLEEYVSGQFDAETLVLNLSGLEAAPALEGLPVSFRSKYFVNALLQGMAKWARGVVSLQLDSNHIRYLSNLSGLDQFAPTVLHLSLVGNDIRNVDDLAPLASLTSLEFIDLRNNPVADSMSRFEYQDAVLALFPNVKTLDMAPMETLIMFDLPAGLLGDADDVATLPYQGSYADAPESMAAAAAFVERFFAAYDGNRRALFSAYHPSGTMSLSVSMRDLNGSSAPGLRDYLEISRSVDMESLDKLTDRLHGSAINISSFLSNIRGTQHDPSSFVVDTVLLPGSVLGEPVLKVDVHGVFLETDTQVKRSFDRVFLLATTQPGTRAAEDGWPVVVLNDQLHIRPYARPISSSE